MAHDFRKFISEVFVNGKFPKILPSKNFPLYGILLVVEVKIFVISVRPSFNSLKNSSTVETIMLAHS